MPPGTLTYLETAAAVSFKRQEELDESVWRTLPFFAASLGLAVALLGRLAETLPLLDASAYARSAYTLMAMSALSFVWAFRWFWSVVAPRAYRYPAADADVQRFARELAAFHTGKGLAGETLDEAVLDELRQFMMREFTAAARSNFVNNGIRLTARSQAMLFTLGGFALAFACGVLIFAHNAYGRSEPIGSRAAMSKSAGSVPLPPATPAAERPVPPPPRFREEGARLLKLSAEPRLWNGVAE